MISKKLRIKDPAVLKSAKKNFCQACGRHGPYLHAHHIKSVGSGGDDVIENILTLCFECHSKAHSGKLDLNSIVLKEMPGVDDLLQIFINHRESEESSKWDQAAALLVLHEGLKMKINSISTETAMSPAMIREMLRTFIAFYNESTRVPELSFYHHRIASKADNPIKWINLSADNNWSTRQLINEMKASGCLSDKSKKDERKSRAEKTIRIINEIFEESDEVSDWLFSELNNLLSGEVKKIS